MLQAEAIVFDGQARLCITSPLECLFENSRDNGQCRRQIVGVPHHIIPHVHFIVVCDSEHFSRVPHTSINMAATVALPFLGLGTSHPSHVEGVVIIFKCRQSPNSRREYLPLDMQDLCALEISAGIARRDNCLKKATFNISAVCCLVGTAKLD